MFHMHTEMHSYKASTSVLRLQPKLEHTDKLYENFPKSNLMKINSVTHELLYVDSDRYSRVHFCGASVTYMPKSARYDSNTVLCSVR